MAQEELERAAGRLLQRPEHRRLPALAEVRVAGVLGGGVGVVEVLQHLLQRGPRRVRPLVAQEELERAAGRLLQRPEDRRLPALAEVRVAGVLGGGVRVVEVLQHLLQRGPRRECDCVG